MSQVSFICTQLNGFKYIHLKQITLFNINHLFAQLNVFIEYTFFSLKIINPKNIDKNILEILDQNLIDTTQSEETCDVLLPTTGTRHIVTKDHKNAHVVLRKRKAYTYDPSHI